MKIIPAIDVRDGRCVRLFQGEFDRETEYSDDPAGVARTFESLGLSRLHVVDLDGARSGQQANQSIVKRIADETQFSVQLGGGIRDAETIRNWLDSGVKRCVIGSAAVTKPAVVKSWLSQLGAEQIILALDVRVDNDGTPTLGTHGWTVDSTFTLWDTVDEYLPHGLIHVLCTDIGRDGALSGPNIDLYREFVDRYPDVRLQASGGVRDIGDLESLRDANVDSAITGRALLDGRITKAEISSFLRAA